MTSSARSAAGTPRVAVFADGCLLPPRDGMSALRLSMLRHLARAGVTVALVHCYRAWTDAELLRAEPFPTLLLPPAAFYAVDGVVMDALRVFRPNIVQADYLSVLTGPALAVSQRYAAALVAEMHYVPTRFFRDQGLPPTELGEVDRLVGLVADLADAVVCWTAHDLRALQAEAGIPARRLHAIAAPVDLSGPRVNYDGGRSLVFVGNLYFHQNATAVEQICRAILPALDGSAPAVTLTVVGDCPSGLLRAADGNRVRVLGYCPDLTQVWASAVAAIAPMSTVNGGVHMKVLTALAAGVPVVGSSAAARGLPRLAGLFVCDSPEDYARELSRLLHDPTLRREVGRAARAQMHETFDAARSARALGRLYGELVSGTRTPKAIIPACGEQPVELRETFRLGRFAAGPPTVSGEPEYGWLPGLTIKGQAPVATGGTLHGTRSVRCGYDT